MAEDGGVYVAGLEYTLNPQLFPHYTEFVREHLRFSVFAPSLASFVHLTHLSVRWTLFLSDLLTIWATLTAARQILRRCVPGDAAQLTGVALLGIWWTLPIAGTSLLLMDPYVTARSFSVPLALFAVAFALDEWPGQAALIHGGDRRPKLSLAGCVASVAAAGIFHPLMAGYGACLVMLVRLSRLRSRWRWWTLAAVAALGLCFVLQRLSPAESPALVLASLSRYYWFLSQWHWFELAGLAGPLLVLPGILHWRRAALLEPAAALVQAAVVLGVTSTLVAALFARENADSHLIARLQPLRAFLFVYAVMALLAGAALGQSFELQYERLRSTRTRLALRIAGFAVLGALAVAMFAVQRASFPASPHIELPWRYADSAGGANPWVRAFLWARENTPRDALFGLDARYVNTAGEDAQTFRAIALRSALPDYSKDGGEASITPQLAAAWLQASTAQQHLSEDTDQVRDARLRPLRAGWMVLSSAAHTAHPCPYDNGAVKVCRLLSY